MTNDDLLDELLRQVTDRVEAHKLQLAHPYALDLIRELSRGGARRKRRADVIDRIRMSRQERGHTMPNKFDDTVQHALEYYCVDSDVFKSRGAPQDEGLFVWPEGKGKGIWSVIPEKAGEWLKKKCFEL